MSPAHSLARIPGAIRETEDGFVFVDWSVVHEELERSGGVDLESVYTDLAREWLMRTAEVWASEYRVYESTHFLILSARGPQLARNLAQLGERTYSTMTESLPELARKTGWGKFVGLVADSDSRYYGYLEEFFPPGEFGASGGVFLSGGYAHFLINHEEPWFQEHALVHELTHALLVGGDLPLWLEEALTQFTEESVLGGGGFEMNREEATRHREFWSREGLGGFWIGTSFARPDEGMELSYVLSQVIVRNMLSRGRDRFLRFVAEARSGDCGEFASQSVYSMSLAEWASQFLGEGDWTPPGGEGTEPEIRRE